MGEAKSLKLPPCKKSCNRCGRLQGSEVYVPSLSCHMYNCLCTGLPFGPPAKCQSKLNKKTLSKQWSKLLSGQSSARACQTASPQLLRKRIFRSQKSPQVRQNFQGLPFRGKRQRARTQLHLSDYFFPKKSFILKNLPCVCVIFVNRESPRFRNLLSFSIFQLFFSPEICFFLSLFPDEDVCRLAAMVPPMVFTQSKHTHTHTHTHAVLLR